MNTATSNTEASAAASSTGVNDAISSRIECPVCCEVFRSPKCLTCGHSVCSDCCDKLLPMLATSLNCPVCRRVTIVPSGGLPTNFALQDLVQQLQTRDIQKRYQCVECDRSCTEEEVWILDTSAGGDLAPRCFRCVISKYSNGGHASTLPVALTSVADLFKRNEKDLIKLHNRVEAFSNEQQKWSASEQKSVATLNDRMDNFIQAGRSLAKRNVDDIALVNNEFGNLIAAIDSIAVPTSLEELHAFSRSVKEVESKLDELADTRCRISTRTNIGLSSMAEALDSLLHAASGRYDEQNMGDSCAGDGDGFVMPNFEIVPCGMAEGPAEADSAMASTSTSSPSTPHNVFSIYNRPGRNAAVRVVTRRGRGYRPPTSNR